MQRKDFDKLNRMKDLDQNEVLKPIFRSNRDLTKRSKGLVLIDFAKYLFVVVLFCILSFPALAQHLSLFNLDNQDYPSVKSDFYAFDKRGNQLIELTKDNVAIKENGAEQRVVKVINPQYKKPKPLSLVLTLDISGSMTGRNMEISKMAARSIIELLPLEQSECAITSFDHQNYINSDFTRNPTQLLEAIDKLKASGGTDYNLALGNPLTGALEVARAGSEKSVVIFLTDGLCDANTTKLIAEANKDGIVVYCVTINLEAPQVLKDIALNTGGRYYERIRTREEAKTIYQQILFLEEELRPSTVFWESMPSCDTLKNIAFTVPEKSLRNEDMYYEVETDQTLNIKISSDFILFNEVNPLITNDTIIELEALNKDVTVLSAKSSNSAFEINSPGFPFIIKKGSVTKVKLRYNPAGRVLEPVKIYFANDRCKPLELKASIRGMGVDTIPIKVEHPNGDEVFYAGTDTTIDWSGVFPGDKVSLDFSSDSGTSWTTITDLTDGKPHRWTVPNLPGERNLIKANARFEGEKSDMYMKPLWTRSDIIGFKIKISPDGSKFITHTSDRMFMYGLKDGSKLGTISAEKNDLPAFSADGKQVYLYYLNERTTVYDAEKLDKMEDIPIFRSSKRNRDPYIHHVDFNNQRTQYLSQDFKTENLPTAHVKKYNIRDLTKIVDVKTGKVVNDLITTYLKAISLHENYLVMGADEFNRPGTVSIWDLDTKMEIAKFTTPESVIAEAQLTRNGKYLVVWSWGFDGTPSYVSVHDMKTKQKMYEFKSPKSVHRGIFVGTDLMVCPIQDSIAIVQVSTGKIVYKPGPSITKCGISADDKYLFTTNEVNGIGPHTCSFYELIPNYRPEIAGTDVSDHVFSIVNPTITSQDVDMGTVEINKMVEHVMPQFIKHPDKIKIKIDSIFLSGVDQESFKIISSRPPFILIPDASFNIEFSFEPTKKGPHDAEINIIYGKNTLRQKIYGNGVQPTFVLEKKHINMGKVKVGTTKDSLVLNVLRNLGIQNLMIKSVALVGPDNQQISIDQQDLKKGKLKKTTAKNLNVHFSPVRRGKTTTTVRFVLKDAPIQDIQIIAKGIAPSEYQLRGRSLNKKTSKSISARIECKDVYGNNPPMIFNSKPNGKYQFKLKADRVYALKGEKEGFSADYDTIDLRTPLSDKDFERDLFLDPEEWKPEANDSMLVIYGLVLDKKSNMPLQSKITYFDSTGTKEVGEIHINRESGSYFIELEYGQAYKFMAESERYLPVIKDINRQESKEVRVIRQDFLLSRPIMGEVIQLENVLFVQSKPILLKESHDDLNMLYRFLQSYPDVHIDLAGHTDNQGGDEINLKLSNERVKTIEKYLVSKGISKARLSGKGYGESRPIASNITEQTRRLNRRVEFTVVK